MADQYGPWHGWNGGECPVDGATMVVPCIRQLGEVKPTCAASLEWSHDADFWEDHILAYRARRQPVVETVWVQLWNFGDLLAKGTIQTRDGIPDMTTLRWEDAQ